LGECPDALALRPVAVNIATNSCASATIDEIPSGLAIPDSAITSSQYNASSAFSSTTPIFEI